MQTGLIASRYAKALYEFASEMNAQEIVFAIFQTLEKSFSANAELAQALKNPLLTRETKKQLIQFACGNKSDFILERFMDVLLQNRREYLLRNIGLKYSDYYYENKNLALVKLTTASPMDAETEKKLISQIKTYIKKELKVEKIIAPEIIGGFIIEIGNRRWDGSLATQLKKIQKELNENILLT